MRSSRPPSLPYSCRGGIYDSIVTTVAAPRPTSRSRQQPHQVDTEDHDGLFEIFERALHWGRDAHYRKQAFRDRRGYRFLDTFLNDMPDPRLLQQVMDEKGPVKFLLVDPESQYARSRFMSVSDTIGKNGALDATKSGLKKILNALSGEPSVGDQEPKDLIKQIQSKAGKRNLELELKFYSVIPGGPLFFFGDIVLAGRYSYAGSSRHLFWDVIVDDFNASTDRYDLLHKEFELIWKNAHSEPGAGDALLAAGGRGVFVSYEQGDGAREARRIKAALESRGVETFVADADIRSGDDWPDALMRRLTSASEVILLLTEGAATSRWVRMELGAAWALNKRVTPVGFSDNWEQLLPDVYKKYQGVNASTEAGYQRLLDDVAWRRKPASAQHDGK